MKKLMVAVQCMATYNSSILVPDDMPLEDAIQYAKKNIDSIPSGNLKWVSDSDEIIDDLCYFEKED